MKKIQKVVGHVNKNISRYVLLAIPLLTALAALLGAFAADLGGVNTSLGKAITGAAGAVGVVLTALLFVRNAGIFQLLEKASEAPDAAALVRALLDARKLNLKMPDLTPTMPAPVEIEHKVVVESKTPIAEPKETSVRSSGSTSVPATSKPVTGPPKTVEHPTVVLPPTKSNPVDKLKSVSQSAIDRLKGRK